MPKSFDLGQRSRALAGYRDDVGTELSRNRFRHEIDPRSKDESSQVRRQPNRGQSSGSACRRTNGNEGWTYRASESLSSSLPNDGAAFFEFAATLLAAMHTDCLARRLASTDRRVLPSELPVSVEGLTSGEIKFLRRGKIMRGDS